MSNLTARLLVAAVFIPGILSLLYLVHPYGFFALAFVAAMIAAMELFSMVNPGDRPAQVVGMALTGVTMIVVYRFGGDPRALMTLLVSVPLFGLLVPLVRLGEIGTAGMRSATYAFGPLYIGVPLSFLSLLQRVDPGFVLLSLMLAWFGDTGGYFAGRFLGRHKLYPAVSPKKTVEGSIGGLAGSALGATIASLWYLHGRLPLSHALPLAIVGGALGQAGDLAESLLKRSTGVKDSGGILPGHGGILDRIDALMFTASSVYLYVLWR